MLALLLLAAPARAEDYADSWLHRTLAFQYRIGNPLPLINAPLIGTHNSFNSTSEPPTLSGEDNNQVLSLTQQLDIDVRSLELDVHNVNGRPVVCHGRGADQAHFGCTTERTFAERLVELRDWLTQHPDQVLLLYLEDHLQGAYDAGAQVLDEGLGPLLYKPPPGDCSGMPLLLTRRQVLAAGKQVIPISSCGEGTKWRDLVFDDKAREEFEGGADDLEPYPQCDYTGHFQRFFEDSTYLSFGVDTVSGATPSPGLTPELTRQMTRCGVDLTGFDKLTAGDGRLAASVWSWGKDQPSGPGCAIQRARLRIAPCGARHAFACRGPGRSIIVDLRRGPYARRPSGCRRALPRTGYEAAKLRDAMQAAGVRAVWVKLTRG